MKKLLLILLSISIGFLVTSAHEVNKYKYFCLDIDENPYGIEKRFHEQFLKMGFTTIDHDCYDRLDASEKALTLFAEYDFFINYSGNSSLTLVLRNASGKPIWSNTGYGCTLLSATGDIKKCTKQIMSSFSRLKYKFDESSVAKKDFTHPYINWTEDSVKTYLRQNRISPLEGIYKNYSNDGDGYNIAILKHLDKYYGIILNSDNELWTPGDTKLVLSNIEGKTYDAEYYGFAHQKFNAIAGLTDNRLLEFSIPYNGEILNFSYLKIFPSGIDSMNTEPTSTQSKSTGSGVLIYENIIITNHHVVEGAQKIEAIVNIDGLPETYNARILCSDKTNDLAIVCIKDEKYKKKDAIPFKILPNTIDVGTSVFAMGFPLTNFLGDEVKITDGIISSKSGFNGDIVTYQISVPIQPGNSGGALFDKAGNLVGITNAGIDKTIAENVGYAIKSPYILSLIDSAPITIPLSEGIALPQDNLPELIKCLKPYVVYLRTY